MKNEMKPFLIIVVQIFTSCLAENFKNSCDGLEDLKINCNFNPDDYLNVPEIIRRHGYLAESHTIVTEDGYLLTIHRIAGPINGKKGEQPVFLKHGMLGSSADWILNNNNSLGFVLADEGYDVWLGNDRGNTYSRGHVSLSPCSHQYWNFSWHEMGVYDLPATLYYISNITNQPGEIIYIGHSMGSTQSFVLSSTLPAAAKNIKLIAALGPTAYMTHLTSPIRYLAPFSNDFEWLAKHLGINEFLPHNKVTDFLGSECQKENVKKICDNIYFTILGFDKGEFNLDILPTVMHHEPAGTSTKTVLHYVQEIRNTGKFQQYDYGTQGNLIKYGNSTPPEYNIKNIKRPIYFMYAKNDVFTSSIDVKRVSRKLSNLVGLYEVPVDSFNHADFIFGKDVYTLVYRPLLNVLRNYTKY